MRALTVVPTHPGSVAVIDVPDPEPAEGQLLVEGLFMGVCGTDHEIAAGDYGTAPQGADRLVLGHESLGRVRSAPEGSGFAEGDLVVGVVRRPDPVPCGACAAGHFDMCRNGRYTERGIKERHGYGSELWTVEADYAIAVNPGLADVGVLLEPTSVVAKAWEQVRRVGERSWFSPQRALVTGAGPIGLLAALIGTQLGLEVHVLDRVTSGPKPELVQALGATYHDGSAVDVFKTLTPDVVIEATGAGQLVFEAMAYTASYGIVCLTGVSSAGHKLPVDAGGLNRELVLENDVVLGSVNANLEHYRSAAVALAAADRDWLARLITRRVPLADAAEALTTTGSSDDIKTVVRLSESD
ncbi:glucose 1-dehydrogenase [Labedaea rhizosphaerae]|uniref:Threonine dehydrogenase-like Zn-dependent dehydrogenase n=1 Tax=Labedaea rhizosphaerae TaxID=598644 RepID=A0A4R6SFS7_LABRH|nr:glucose 1-dehydrogenase [Labedaea rhizosphaerae]TDQ00360.1 threonine dehydrogenase-like Zn-dependent dehydrogenase [Labedaea rhizosphaerae]